MDMRPLDQMTTTEQSAWDWAKDQDEFHVSDLSKMAGIGANSATKFLCHWESEGRIGLVRKVRNSRWFASVDKILARAAAQAPTLNKATPEGNMWRAMRGLKTFSPLDLAAHSNVGGIVIEEEDARRYCQQLLRVGYLRAVDKAIPGRRSARYRLIRNSGPLAPQHKRVRGIYDPNDETFEALSELGS